MADGEDKGQNSGNDAAPANKLAATAGTTNLTQPMVDAQDARTNARERIEASREVAENDRKETVKPAKIGGAEANEFEASGSVIEDKALDQIDVDHPAVDNNPRAGTTARQNQIDFNDPELSDRKAVEQRLGQQS